MTFKLLFVRFASDSTLSQFYVCVLIHEQPNQISLLLTGVAGAYYTTHEHVKTFYNLLPFILDIAITHRKAYLLCSRKILLSRQCNFAIAQE